MGPGFMGCTDISCTWRLRAATAKTDGGIVDVNGRGIGIQAGGIVVDAPSAVAIGIAGLHIGNVQDLDAVLPESDVPILFP